jgi:hypothetical protein
LPEARRSYYRQLSIQLSAHPDTVAPANTNRTTRFLLDLSHRRNHRKARANSGISAAFQPFLPLLWG